MAAEEVAVDGVKWCPHKVISAQCSECQSNVSSNRRGCGSPVKAQAHRRQHGWTCPQPARVQVFVANAWICAPQATDRDPQSFNVNAWICAHQSTDCDLESVFVKRKVNAWICARHSTDRDLESVFNVNAWICACQTTDRDLETKK